MILLYWQTLTSLVLLWQEPPYSHGYVVFPAALYLAWRRRSHIEQSAPIGSKWAVLLLAVLSFGWLLGHLSSTAVVQQFCVVAMFIGLAWAVVGTAAARRTLMPLTLLLFAVPVGDRLVPLLQDFTAHFATAMLRISSIPVFLEGHVIAVPGSRWQVATLCSGISYLLSSTAVGFVYAALMYRSWPLRVAFFVASLIVPLVANGLRVYTIILIAGMGANGIASGIEHYLYGSLFFVLIIMLLFAVAGRWTDRSPSEWTLPPAEPRAIEPQPSRRIAALAAIAMMTMAAAPLSVRTVWSTTAAAAATRPTVPRVTLPWQPVAANVFDWSPSFIEPRAQWIGGFRSAKTPVKLYVSFYSADQAGVKLATVANVVYNDGWLPVGRCSVSVVLDGQAFEVQETIARSPASSVVIWHWYLIDGRLTGNDYVARALLAKARFMRSRKDAVAFAAAVEQDSTDRADEVLRDFVSHLSLVGIGGLGERLR